MNEPIKKNLNKSEEEIKNEFLLLKKLIDNDEKHYSKLVEESDKNRYCDIRPYIYNKVPLSNNNYINASFINIPKKNFSIVTQGPLENTIEDFWQMIFDYNIKVIIMLCKLTENGKEKCFDYWNEENLSFDVQLIEEKKENNNFKIRKFKVSKRGKTKNIIQYNFIGWNDHNVPLINDIFEIFIYMFKLSDNYKGNFPVLIHCSAGVGRTGTFLSLYILYKEIERQVNNVEIKFSIFNLVRKLKEMRLFFVENILQYNFLYNFTEKMLCYFQNKIKK